MTDKPYAHPTFTQVLEIQTVVLMLASQALLPSEPSPQPLTLAISKAQLGSNKASRSKPPALHYRFSGPQDLS